MQRNTIINTFDDTENYDDERKCPDAFLDKIFRKGNASSKCGFNAKQNTVDMRMVKSKSQERELEDVDSNPNSANGVNTRQPSGK